MSWKRPTIEALAVLLTVAVLAALFALYFVDMANPPRAESAWIEVGFTVPDTYADNGEKCGLPDSSLVDSSGALLQGSPMHTVRMAYLYGYLFRDFMGLATPPPYRLLDSLDVRGMEGKRVTMLFSADPGMMGGIVVSVANHGLESCKVGGYVFGIPAVDSLAPLAAALRDYELVWKKP